MAEAPARALQLDRDLRDVVVSGERLLVSTFRQASVLVVGDKGMSERLTMKPARAAFASQRDVKGPPTLAPPTASPAVAWRLVPAPGAQALVLHQRGLDGEVGTQPGSYGAGPTCAGIVEGVVTRVEDWQATGTPTRSGPALAGAVLALDMAVAPGGKQLAVVSAGLAGRDGQLRFYDLAEATTEPSPNRPCVDGAVAPAPPGPPGTSNDDMLPPPLEYRPPNGEVVAVAFDPRGNILVQSREPAQLQILTQRAVPVVLSTASRADLGHQAFHAATSANLACASCHPEGGDDGRTWRFSGLGPRRTQSLRGGILDTAPFHWDGDLVSFDHLMSNVFQGRMAGVALDRPRQQALGAWLDAIPSLSLARVADEVSVLRGKALFVSSAVGCATCHSGSDFTNGSAADVGTGGAFQVPQLHSLAARAPFMHDGCAATLMERFTKPKCGGDDRHGVTSKLTEGQLRDLVAFLETL
jgi:cytochrome c553